MAKALYRKYRPTKLEDVVGQESVTEPLKNAIKRKSFAHSYLFIGPRGCGKTSVARIFAHAINNFKYELEDNYVDIIEIDAASNTGVDNIRELREKAIITPTEGQYKVYIIDEVHMLSKSAFNALLKIMEEPPRHVIFMMATTDPEKVPITITSRAQTFTFKLAPDDVMKEHLKGIAKTEKIDIEDGALDIIIHRGGGSFRDCISLLDQISNLKESKITADDVNEALGLPTDEILNNLLTTYTAQDVVKITTLIKELINSGIKPETIAAELIDHIIKNPKPEFIPLLKTLPDVYGQFPEAKLLVALLEIKGTKPVTVQAAVSGTSPPASPKTYIPDVDQRMTFSGESGVPETVASTATDFVSSISNISSGIANIINKSKLEETETEIHIYPTSKTYEKILSTSANQDILAKAASGKKVTIHSPSEKPNSSPFSQISDIMGTVEEVQSSDGDPFAE